MMAENLLQNLLYSERANVYALLDGASIQDLPQILYEKAPPHFCLFRGNLRPDMASVAPYVVGLVRNAPFTEWLLASKPGQHFGVFAMSRQSIQEMRFHFRDLFIVYREEGDPMYFRFYDPRVMRAFLPTCTPEELKTFFGPIDRFIAENDDGSAYSTFRIESEKLSESVANIDTEDDA